MIISGKAPTRFVTPCEQLATGDVFYPESAPAAGHRPPFMCTGHDAGFCFAVSLESGSQVVFKARMVAVVSAAVVVESGEP